jgi:hypothetical protein
MTPGPVTPRPDPRNAAFGGSLIPSKSPHFLSSRDDHTIHLGHSFNMLKEDERAIFSAAAHRAHATRPRLDLP